MNGKPSTEAVYNLNRNNLIVLLSQLYLKNGDYLSAATILVNGGICSDSITSIDSYTVESIIECVQTF